MGDGFVPRPELTNRIVRALLTGKGRKVGITTALTGAGGFGKTTLARDVCGRSEVKAAFPWIYWVPVGQELRGAALADAINDISERVDGQRPGLTSPEQAAIRLGELLKAKGRCLLVVDDIWTTEQLRPFLDAGRGCTLLLTTRFSTLLPDDATPVEVDQMNRLQARDLVTGGLALPPATSEQLLDLTGRWPLALGLANGVLRRAARDGANVSATAERLLQRLRDHGPTALDVTDAARRNRAVAATLESSFSLLGDRRERIVELGIFPEDTELPLELVALLWRATAGLRRDEADELTRELADLSLILRSAGQSELRLHDVIRSYLQHECGATRMKSLHSILLDAIASELLDDDQRPRRWWRLPDTSGYLWRNLSYHLTGAVRDTEVAALVTDPRWVIAKLRKLGPVAVVEDLSLVETKLATELNRFLDQVGHVLTPTQPEHAVINELAHRLPATAEFVDLRQAASAEVAGLPCLAPRDELPDLPDPALNRVLEGHDADATGCAYTPDGKRLVSSARDGLRLWDAKRGQLIRLVADTASRFDSGFALSPSGHLLAAEGRDDKTIQVLDTDSWKVQVALSGHRDWITCLCFTADERLLISGGADNTVRVWDVATGKQTRVIKTMDTVRACVSLADGRVLFLDDERLNIWNLRSSKVALMTTTRTFGGEDIAVSADQKWAVITGDEGLSVHDLTRTDEPPRILHHHPNLTCAAFSPDGAMLATGSETGSIALWNVDKWRPVGHISAPLAELNKLAFSPDGTVLASVGRDGTTRLWNPAAAAQAETPTKVTSVKARACAVAPDGTWLAVATDDTITIHDPETTQVRETLDFSGRVHSMAAPTSGFLAAELQNEVLVCEVGNWQSSRTLEHPTQDWVHDLSAGGNLVCVTDRSQLVVWNVETWSSPVFLELEESGLRLRDKPLPPRSSPMTTLVRRFTYPIGRLRQRFIGQRFNDWIVRRRVARTRKTIRTLTAQISPDGAWIAIAARNTVHIASTRTWKTIATLPAKGAIEGMLVIQDGQRLAVRTRGIITYWNTENWLLNQGAIESSAIASAEDGAWSPDGTLLALITDDGRIRLLDSSTGIQVTEFRVDGDLSGVVWLSDLRLAAAGARGVYWFDYVPGNDLTDSKTQTGSGAPTPTGMAC